MKQLNDNPGHRTDRTLLRGMAYLVLVCLFAVVVLPCQVVQAQDQDEQDSTQAESAQDEIQEINPEEDAQRICDCQRC